MRRTFVITVGSTVEPIRKSIEDINPAGETRVVLVYGRPFPDQHPSPFEVANDASQLARSKGFAVETREIADPEDLDLCLESFRQVFASHSQAEEMVVNFTAGTKVMAAAAVHAALMAPFVGNLTFDYVGGKFRDQHGRVLSESMATRSAPLTVAREMLDQTIRRLSQWHYEEARVLAEGLPKEGKARFVRQAADALYLWDDFDYNGAIYLLRRLYEASQALVDDKEVGGLARLVVRMVKYANKIESLVNFFTQAQRTRQPLGSDRGRAEEQFREDLPLLVADILESSRRRYLRKRPTESVLRSYRAVEVAVQGSLLFRYQINPWNPDWVSMQPATIEQFRKLSRNEALPKDLALYNGFCLLRCLGLSIGEECEKALTDLLQTRNQSYLEHGYTRVQEEAAERLNQVAVRLCEEIVACSLEQLRVLVRHDFGS